MHDTQELRRMLRRVPKDARKNWRSCFTCRTTKTPLSVAFWPDEPWRVPGLPAPMVGQRVALPIPICVGCLDLDDVNERIVARLQTEGVPSC
jgi:hypothetical protein